MLHIIYNIYVMKSYWIYYSWIFIMQLR